MPKVIVEIREVRLTPEGLQWGPTIDATKLLTDAAVRCFRLNQRALGTDRRYVYRQERIG